MRVLRGGKGDDDGMERVVPRTLFSLSLFFWGGGGG